MLMMGRRYGVEFPGSADEGGGPDEAVSLVDDGTATVVCVWETKVSQKSGDWRVAVSFFTFTWVCTSPMSKEGMCHQFGREKGGGSCLPPWRLPWWRCCAPILTVCAVLLLLSVLKDIRWRVAPHWQCVSFSFTPTTAASPQNAEGSPLETGCRQLGDVHMRSNNRT